MPEISYLLAVAVSPCPVQEEWLAAVINNSFDKLISLVETDWAICHQPTPIKAWLQWAGKDPSFPGWEWFILTDRQMVDIWSADGCKSGQRVLPARSDWELVQSAAASQTVNMWLPPHRLLPPPCKSHTTCHSIWGRHYDPLHDPLHDPHHDRNHDKMIQDGALCNIEENLSQSSSLKTRPRTSERAGGWWVGGR